MWVGLISNIKNVFKKASPIHPAPLPPGVKIILWYTGLLSIFQFIIGLSVPLAYPQMLSLNPMLVLFNFIFLFVSGIIIYGINRREYWAYKVTIIWYFVAIVYNFLYFFYTFDFFDVMAEILLIGLVFSFIVNCVVIWYLFSQKDYFKHKGIFLLHRRIRLKILEANDHIFMVVFSAFWFVTILVLCFAGIKLMKDTFDMSADVLEDAKQSGMYDSSVCFKEEPLKKDACLMTFGIVKKDTAFCSYITSAFYKFTCYMGAS